MAFKGEDDPTSIPGTFFGPNTTFVQFQILGSPASEIFFFELSYQQKGTLFWAVEIWLPIHIYTFDIQCHLDCIVAVALFFPLSFLCLLFGHFS